MSRLYSASVRTRRTVATIRSLFRFLVQQGVLRESPAEELLPPEREREERRVLTEAEYKRLMAAVQHQVRDGAILELLLQTGIRQSECAAIALGDMQLPARVSRDQGNVGSLRKWMKRHSSSPSSSGRWAHGQSGTLSGSTSPRLASLMPLSLIHISEPTRPY